MATATILAFFALITFLALVLIFVEYAAKTEVYLSTFFGPTALKVYLALVTAYWIKCNVYFG